MKRWQIVKLLIQDVEFTVSQSTAAKEAYIHQKLEPFKNQRMQLLT